MEPAASVPIETFDSSADLTPHCTTLRLIARNRRNEAASRLAKIPSSPRLTVGSAVELILSSLKRVISKAPFRLPGLRFPKTVCLAPRMSSSDQDSRLVQAI